MVLNGRVLPMIAIVVKSIPNQVELLIGLPVILSLEYNLLTDLATWRVHDFDPEICKMRFHCFRFERSVNAGSA